MYCSRCGRQVSNILNRCPDCGGALVEKKPNLDSNEVERIKRQRQGAASVPTPKNIQQPVATATVTKKPESKKKEKKSIFKRWWFWAVAAVLIIIIIGGANGGETDRDSHSNVTTENTDGPPLEPTQTPVSRSYVSRDNQSSFDTPEATEELISEAADEVAVDIEYNELQDFYVSFPLGVSIDEAVSFVESRGLPYTNHKYNGSRVIQVSTEEEGTLQRYNKSNLPYITIRYDYAKGENSINDDMEKYSFESIEYVPREGYFTFDAVSELYGRIYRLGTDINQNLSREDQMAFFYQYKDDKNSFK